MHSSSCFKLYVQATQMTQSKRSSLLEALTQTGIGYLQSCLIWWVLVWGAWFDINTSIAEGMFIQAIYTVASVLRGYVIRRYYNWRLNKC
jgi:ABC-type protease/lipase transport system fused ATPase/permease subunit